MDHVFNDAPDIQFAFIFECKRIEFLVFRTEFDLSLRDEETLDREFTIDGSDNDITIGSGNASVDDQQIVGENSGTDHRFASNFDEER